MKGLYLILIVVTALIPLVLSFDKKVNFVQKWKYALIAIFIVSIPFLAWDVWFVLEGVWGFNDRYLVGFFVYNIPIEELLFFYVVPFVSIFIYECVQTYVKVEKWVTSKFITFFLYGLLLVDFIFLLPNLSQLYSLIISTVVPFVVLIYFRKIINDSLMWLAFVSILIPFLLFNGALTGMFTSQPIVWYNESQFSGIRFISIPLEDFYYLFILTYSNLFLYKFIQIFYKK